ncbi:hypothetical protein KIPB_000012 [Kipferlia bialata]|uniref:Uncharacterized protein n=1 Tax=Kipferlia bialata TaxID=797122 RepID=A0A9K3CNA7_9EUKA|nr:hypothetical protein KIPB_000012 [Kipferlia bialata]|eukprot:g12.t1
MSPVPGPSSPPRHRVVLVSNETLVPTAERSRPVDNNNADKAIKALLRMMCEQLDGVKVLRDKRQLGPMPLVFDVLYPLSRTDTYNWTPAQLTEWRQDRGYSRPLIPRKHIEDTLHEYRRMLQERERDTEAGGEGERDRDLLDEGSDYEGIGEGAERERERDMDMDMGLVSGVSPTVNKGPGAVTQTDRALTNTDIIMLFNRSSSLLPSFPDGLVTFLSMFPRCRTHLTVVCHKTLTETPLLELTRTCEAMCIPLTLVNSIAHLDRLCSSVLSSHTARASVQTTLRGALVVGCATGANAVPLEIMGPEGVLEQLVGKGAETSSGPRPPLPSHLSAHASTHASMAQASAYTDDHSYNDMEMSHSHSVTHRGSERERESRHGRRERRESGGVPSAGSNLPTLEMQVAEQLGCACILLVSTKAALKPALDAIGRAADRGGEAGAVLRVDVCGQEIDWWKQVEQHLCGKHLSAVCVYRDSVVPVVLSVRENDISVSIIPT